MQKVVLVEQMVRVALVQDKGVHMEVVQQEVTIVKQLVLMEQVGQCVLFGPEMKDHSLIIMQEMFNA